MTPLPIKIAGLGRALPEQIITSTALEQQHGLEAGWIERRSGVRERRWVTAEESNSGLGATAVHEAVANAGLNLTDIDLFINASGSVEQAIPDGGALLQRALGLQDSGIPCFSVHATCLSFINALQVAAGLLHTHQYHHIVISSAEIASRALNFHEPESWTLLGDAAAAVVLTRTPPGESSAIHAMQFATYSEGAYLTALNGGGTRLHPSNPATRPEDNLFTMDGPQVLRRVMRYSPSFLESLQPGLSNGLGDINMVVPHQASLIGIKMLRLFRWPEEKIATTIQWLGNCVAASVPVTLYEAVQQGQIQRGDKILLIGSGAGLSLGGVVLQF
jgi:3-oxoacyl-[acyl-carrier-protein] synthase III